MRFAPALAAVALVSASGVVSAGCGGAGLPASDHPLMHESAPTRREASLDGDMISLPQKGKVTVVDFWATTCRPCAELMPAIEALYEEKKGDGLTVVGIAVDDNPGLVQNRLKERGVTYPNILDASSTIEGAYKVTDLPQTFVFDRSGKLRFFTKGGTVDEVAKIRSAVEALVAEAPAP